MKKVFGCLSRAIVGLSMIALLAYAFSVLPALIVFAMLLVIAWAVSKYGGKDERE